MSSSSVSARLRPNATRQFQARRQQGMVGQVAPGQQRWPGRCQASGLRGAILRKRGRRLRATLGGRLLQPEHGAHVVVLVLAARAPGRVAAFELGVAIPHLGRALQVFLRFQHIALGKLRLDIDARQRVPGFGQPLLAGQAQPAHGLLEVGRAVRLPGMRLPSTRMRAHHRPERELGVAVLLGGGQLPEARAVRAASTSCGDAAGLDQPGAARQQGHLVRRQPRAGRALRRRRQRPARAPAAARARGRPASCRRPSPVPAGRTGPAPTPLSAARRSQRWPAGPGRRGARRPRSALRRRRRRRGSAVLARQQPLRFGKAGRGPRPPARARPWRAARPAGRAAHRPSTSWAYTSPARTRPPS